MRSSLFIIGMLSIIVCSASNMNQKANQNQPSTKSNNSANILLETFTQIPADVEGASCLYYSSTKDKKSEKFICVINLGDCAYMKINGKLIRLEQVSYKERIYIYKNDIYTLKIKVTKSQTSEYESYVEQGIMTISTKNSKKEQPFIGDCGC